MLDTNRIQMLTRSLDAAALRQRVVADNIANVDTPNYKSRNVAFEDELRKALSDNDGSSFEGYRTDPRHLVIGGVRPMDVMPKIVFNSTGIMQNNGNNVDLDAEMTKMAENQLWYNALIDDTNNYYRNLTKAITGGKS